MFQPQNSFTVTIFGDNVFEGDEKIVITIDPTMRLPEPFKSTKIPYPPNSVVQAPPARNINVSLKSTTIFIRETGMCNLVLIV